MSKSEKIVSRRESRGPSVVFFCDGSSLTKQAEAGQCDINYLYNRYAKAGVDLMSLPVSKFSEEIVSGDVIDYVDMYNKVAAVGNAFSTLSAEQREYFQNDAMRFANALVNLDEKSAKNLVNIGILPESSLKSFLPPANPSPAGGEASSRDSGNAGVPSNSAVSA